eukprot:scaffold7042_cov60-Phaeocystis_antarctica.AAC.2
MSSYVRLRGLPFGASEREVAQWFACAPRDGGRVNIGSVHFAYKAGRKSGEAVCSTAYPQVPGLHSPPTLSFLVC